jgi:membrane protease YdiL (CAAX protease family)
MAELQRPDQTSPESTPGSPNGRAPSSFIFSQDGRPRSGWMIAVFVTVYVMALGLGGVVLVALFGLGSGREQRPLCSARTFVAALVSVAAVLAATAVGELAVKDKPLDWGLKHARPFQQALIGFIAGGGILSVSVIAGWLVEHEKISSTLSTLPSAFGSVLLLSVNFLLVAVGEEMLFRGFVLRQLQRGLGAWAAIAISGGLFGVFHLATPDASRVSTAVISLSGVLFAVLVVRTGSLWCSMGLHAGWNWFEGFVWGQPVSGKLTGVTMLKSDVYGDSIWTGGRYGPEASIPIAIVLIAAIVLVVAWRRPHLPRGA